MRTKKNKKVRIGCASGFWGDTSTAAKQLVDDDNIDYLIFDFLSEVTMSILAGAKLKDPNLGYAKDFISQLKPLLYDINRKNIKIISNAGGINPESCRSRLLHEAKKIGLNISIGVVYGDNLMSDLEKLKNMNFKEIDSGEKFPKNILSMNAYLGAPAIASALKEGADIVITGRCVDSAMALAPLIHEFNWGYNDYDCLAGGSLAGHIIECGAQCTGGNFTDWEKVTGFDNIGFPIVEVESNGNFTVTKPKNTGGIVSFGTVAEQFLYEIGNPSRYVLPDVICDFSKVKIIEVGENLVQVQNAKGIPPTNFYKVSATHMKGYNVIGKLVIGGQKAKKKGEIIAKAILKKTSKILEEKKYEPFTETKYDLIGTNSIYGSNNIKENSKELLLRIMVKHKNKEALVLFSKEIAQAVTGMTAGVMNYLGGRPKVSKSIHLFSYLIDKSLLRISVRLNNKNYKVTLNQYNEVPKKLKANRKINIIDRKSLDTTISLFKIAYARSGDKGDHANIGVIARKPEYLPYIQNALTNKKISSYFSHFLKGDLKIWDVPGISGINILLKNSLGGGGMASFNIDPQGKSYAQQLLELEIPIPFSLKDRINYE